MTHLRHTATDFIRIRLKALVQGRQLLCKHQKLLVFELGIWYLLVILSAVNVKYLLESE